MVPTSRYLVTYEYEHDDDIIPDKIERGDKSEECWDVNTDWDSLKNMTDERMYFYVVL